MIPAINKLIFCCGNFKALKVSKITFSLKGNLKPPPPETKIIPRNAPVPNISESDYAVSTTLYTAFKMVELRSDYANER